MADSLEPHSGRSRPPGNVRASHDDRAAIVGRLQEAGLAGRLDPDELDERTTAALSARTLGDLAELVRDLPGESPLGPGRPEPPPHRDQIGSELYQAKRDGRWTVPSELDVRVDGGVVILDFTEAEITSPTLDIAARVRGGSLTLITRPGIEVHTHDLMVDNGTVKVDTAWDEDGLTATALVTLATSVTPAALVTRAAPDPGQVSDRELRPYQTLGGGSFLQLGNDGRA